MADIQHSGPSFRLLLEAPRKIELILAPSGPWAITKEVAEPQNENSKQNTAQCDGRLRARGVDGLGSRSRDGAAGIAYDSLAYGKYHETGRAYLGLFATDV